MRSTKPPGKLVESHSDVQLTTLACNVSIVACQCLVLREKSTYSFNPAKGRCRPLLCLQSLYCALLRGLQGRSCFPTDDLGLEGRGPPNKCSRSPESPRDRTPLQLVSSGRFEWKLCLSRRWRESRPRRLHVTGLLR